MARVNRRLTVFGLVVALSVVGARAAQTQRASNSLGAGAGAKAASGEAIVPFKIHVPDSVVADLKQRLQRARFADEIPEVGWDYGTNLAYLKELVTYWRDKYDWRAQERRLNQYDQFKTNIDGLDIHFIHQRSKVPNAKPLLLLNGWPSSIEEYTKVIGPLTDPAAHGGRATDAFHVVIPSMPGYGFSDKPRERGYNPERMAGVWVKLMARLGYTRYLTHGSDWGIAVATHLALKDPGHLAALHLAGCPGGLVGQPPSRPAGAPPPPPAPPPPAAPVSANLGYQEIQTTKPQTLGHGLSDSPLGLASWIIDKWQSWTDHDGDLEKVYTKDQLLTNVMIYWVTNSGASSARLYYESRHVDGRLLPTFFENFLPKLPEGHVNVPTGCGTFPSQYDRRDIPISTNTAAARKAAESRYNVVYLTISPHGGHFPALEQPQVWADDIRAFFRDRPL
jgi:pimeloyl-ACP methyl ester carboxylesterase